MNTFLFMGFILVVLLVLYGLLRYAWRNQYFVSDVDLLENLQDVNYSREARLLAVAPRSTDPDIQKLYQQIQSSIQAENNLITEYLNNAQQSKSQ